jgi:hypothetical protein
MLGVHDQLFRALSQRFLTELQLFEVLINGAVDELVGDFLPQFNRKKGDQLSSDL